MNNTSTLSVELHTYHWQVIFDLVGQSNQIDISGGIQLRLDGSYEVKDTTHPSIFYLALTFAGGMATDLLVNMAASWLYDKLKRRQQDIPHLIIERTEVEIDEEQIRKVIAEKIELHSSDGD